MNQVPALVVRAALLCLVVHGAIALTFLQLGRAVPDATLPIALAVGSILAWLAPAPRALVHDPSRASRLVVGLGVALLAIAGAMLVVGSFATPARTWDGATSWELRARAFAAAPTLEQPFFRDPGVYGHTREYPVLQPLLLAGLARLGLGMDGARLLFPLLWLLLLGVVGDAWRRLGVARASRAWLLPAFALTPMLVDPTMGGVDSGFADLLALLALTGAAAGLATRDVVATAAGVFLAVVSKPEGLLHAVILATVAWCAGEFRMLCAVTLGGIAGAVAWLPLYAGLVGESLAVPELVACLATTAVPILVSGALLARYAPRPALRLGVLAVGAGLALTGAWLLAPAFEGLGARSGVLGVYLDGFERAKARLVELPRILGWLAAHAVHPRHYGLIAWLLLALAFASRKSPAPPPAGERRVLATLLCLGLASVTLPFLVSPEPDLGHHVRSSMDRLLLHWLGVAWLLAGACWPNPQAPAETGLTR